MTKGGNMAESGGSAVESNIGRPVAWFGSLV